MVLNFSWQPEKEQTVQYIEWKHTLENYTYFDCSTRKAANLNGFMETAKLIAKFKQQQEQ